MYIPFEDMVLWDAEVDRDLALEKICMIEICMIMRCLWLRYVWSRDIYDWNMYDWNMWLRWLKYVWLKFVWLKYVWSWDMYDWGMFSHWRQDPPGACAWNVLWQTCRWPCHGPGECLCAQITASGHSSDLPALCSVDRTLHSRGKSCLTRLSLSWPLRVISDRRKRIDCNFRWLQQFRWRCGQIDLESSRC